MIVYFRWEKDRIERKKIADAAKGVGKPKVGGKFELVDQMGRTWTEASLKGGFTLVRRGRVGSLSELMREVEDAIARGQRKEAMLE